MICFFLFFVLFFGNDHTCSSDILHDFRFETWKTKAKPNGITFQTQNQLPPTKGLKEFEFCEFTRKKFRVHSKPRRDPDIREFRAPGSGSGSVGSVNLISELGFVAFGYPKSGYPSRYYIISEYSDPDP